jgi:hypothetical protein
MTNAAVRAAWLSAELAGKPSLRRWVSHFSGLHQACVHGIKLGLMLAGEECVAPEPGVPQRQRYGSRTHRSAASESCQVVSVSGWRRVRVVGSGLDVRLRRGPGLLGVLNGV